MKKILSFIIFLFSLTVAMAESDSIASTLKPYFEYMLIHHEPRFDKIPEIEYCCPGKTDINNGSGWGAGLKYELALPNSMFLGLKFGVYSYDAVMGANEWKKIRIGDAVEDMLIRHHTIFDFTNLHINPYLKLNLFYNVSIFAGGYASPYLAKKYEIYEEIIKPENKVFEDTKTRTRNHQSDNYKGEMGLWGGMNFGIAYDLYLFEDQVFLSPEISYSLGLNNAVNRLDWEVNSLNFGLNLGFNFHKHRKIQDIRSVFYTIDTVYVRSKFYKDIYVRGAELIDSTIKLRENIRETRVFITRIDTLFRGRKYEISLSMSNPDLTIEIRKANQEFQNLNVIFFKPETAELLDRYELIAPSDFNLDSIPANAIDIHYNLLNIIGYRMSQCDAIITLVGETDSLNTRELIDSRFYVISDYLAKTWNIDKKRIKTKISRAPRSAKNKHDERCIEEMNKIRISTKDLAILSPIKKVNFDEIKQFLPEQAKISVNLDEYMEISAFHLMMYQGKRMIFEEEGEGAKEDFTVPFNEQVISKLDVSKPIDMTYIATLPDGKKVATNDVLNINKVALNEKVSRLALIFFEFDSDKIAKNSLAQIDELTKYITDKSIVRISGYSDDIGDLDYNMELSNARAQNVADFIKQYNPNAYIESVKGYADTEFANGITSYGTPVERYLSRTVVIEVFDVIE